MSGIAKKGGTTQQRPFKSPVMGRLEDAVFLFTEVGIKVVMIMSEDDISGIKVPGKILSNSKNSETNKNMVIVTVPAAE